MTNTILGYEVASPEQQRKTALAILGVIGAIAIGGLSILFLISHWEQSGRHQVLATIDSFETKCRYVVRNLSKRVSYYDHTGYIDCDEAQAVADANNNALGSVQRRTMAAVDFNTIEGEIVHTTVALHGDVPVSVGQQVEILYRTDDPSDAVEFNKIPIFGRDSVAPTTETVAPAEALQDAETAQSPKALPEPATPQRRPSDSVSESTKMWIGLGGLLAMILVGLWLIRCAYRAVRWLIAGNQSDKSAQPDVTQPPAARISAVTHYAPRGSFGQRRVQ
ncbi:MAG: hypothetical protein OER56_14895 [Hyphomicrobiales bacterium]|nr:hypothetical protein [Hyphomicrobiales bacterium]